MAFSHSPKIVTNGLVLALDAGNVKSYPGTGTTWFDKSGNNNNGTLTNGPTFDTGSLGSIVFDGTNDYINYPVSTPSLGLSTFSLECWFNKQDGGTTANSGAGGILFIPLIAKGRGEAEGDNRDMNYCFGINTSNQLCADFENITNSSNHPITTSTVLSNGIWYHAVACYDGSKWEIFLNSIMIGTLVVNTTPRFDSIQGFSIATAKNSTGVTQGAYKGSISTARVYNRALSSQEVLQNYNATKGRFGL